MSIRIFVYGTLRRGQPNHRVLEGVNARRVRAPGGGFLWHTDPSFTMRDLGSYPGIFAGGSTSIVGELYELESVADLEPLDRLEGHPTFYQRKRIRMTEDDEMAWAYLLPASRERPGLPQIISGDWVRYASGEDDHLATVTRTLYFAFGSNLSPEQMRDRCPSADLIGTASLPRHRLAFAGPSPTWGGGVATVMRDRKSDVPGVLWSVTWADLEQLDSFEGHPTFYRREAVRVELDDGSTAEAWTYQLAREEVAPSPAYLQALVDGYAAHGLDESVVIEAARQAGA